MSELIESAVAILSGSERRLEIIANNVANVTTVGFKRRVGFSERIDAASGSTAQKVQIGSFSQFAQGKMSPSIDAFDMALSGDGFFELRAGDRTIYSRQGQFRLTADGTLVTPLGHVLQQQGGGDLVLANAAVTILEDGTVLDDGRPVARIALAAPDRLEAMIPVGASAFAADASSMHASDAVVRQGMTESSNVSLSEEMVAMTSVARQAETGARLVQVYDDLLARAISTLGQGR